MDTRIKLQRNVTTCKSRTLPHLVCTSALSTKAGATAILPSKKWKPHADDSSERPKLALVSHLVPPEKGYLHMDASVLDSGHGTVGVASLLKKSQTKAKTPNVPSLAL